MAIYTEAAKKDIERISAAISIRDAFAAPLDVSYRPTDPAQLLIDERKLKMLSYFAGTEAARLSDYEQFFEFVSVLDAMQGSAEKEIFTEELKLLYSKDVLDHIDDPKELWEIICEKMSLENCNFTEHLQETTKYNKIKTVRIFTNIDHFENYADFLADQTKKIKSSNAEYVTIDISVLNFARTDDFHAARAYEQYKVGDRAALDTALSGALYPVLSAIKEAGKRLLLNIEDNFTAAEKMLEYFRGRDIMPNTVIFAKRESRRVAEQLCGVYKTPKGELFVGAGLLYYEGDTARDVKNRFLDIAAAYPTDKLFVGGAMTSSLLVAARHNLLRRGIAEAIYELCEDMSACLEMAENM